MKTFNKRAADFLDVSVVADVALERLKTTCKKAVLHGAKGRVDVLKKAKSALEVRLNVLVNTAASGIIAFFKKASIVKQLKREIAEINAQIVQWINSLYRRYIG